MNLQQLRHFVAIADNGSLREAAKALNLSQSAITKSLKLLEQQLGVQLIERGSRGSLLTPHGKEVVAHARLVGAELDALRKRLREMTGKATGALHIGTAAAVSIELLPEAILAFRARYPRAEIFVHGGLPLKLLPRLLDGSIDLLIGPRPGVTLPPSVNAVPLFVSKNVIALRKGHPLQRARSLQEFAGAKWILTAELSMPDSHLGLAHATCKMSPPTIVLQTDEPFLTERLVARTDYVTVLRKCFFQSDLVPSDLVPVEFPEIELGDDFALLTRKAGHPSLMAERFMEILQMQAAKINTSPPGPHHILSQPLGGAPQTPK